MAARGCRPPSLNGRKPWTDLEKSLLTAPLFIALERLLNALLQLHGVFLDGAEIALQLSRAGIHALTALPEVEPQAQHDDDEHDHNNNRIDLRLHQVSHLSKSSLSNQAGAHLTPLPLWGATVGIAHG